MLESIQNVLENARNGVKRVDYGGNLFKIIGKNIKRVEKWLNIGEIVDISNAVFFKFLSIIFVIFVMIFTIISRVTNSTRISSNDTNEAEKQIQTTKPMPKVKILNFVEKNGIFQIKKGENTDF